MKKLEKDSIVKVDNKQIKINEVLDLLVGLPANDIVDFFKEAGISFPRLLRMEALREVLNPYVENTELMLEKLTDEENFRLRWYEGFSEHQLVNLLSILKEEELFSEFRENLWLTILAYLFEHGVNETVLNALFNKANKAEKSQLSCSESLNYNNKLNEIFYDEPNTIDGLKPGIFRPILYKCSTLVEIREIGLKYDVNVPRRLKKAELVEIIKEELVDRQELTQEIEDLIDNMNVISLQRFAINNNIKASIELKKEEIIEYILKNAKQTTQEYFKPSEFSAYEVVEGLEHLEEVVEEEPEVVEEVVEEEPEVVEEVVEEEPEVVEEVVEEEPEVVEEVVEEERKVVEEVIKEEPKVVEEVVEEKTDAIFANEINVVFPYIAAVKKRSFKKSFNNIKKEELYRAKVKEDKAKGAIRVKIVGGLDEE